MDTENNEDENIAVLLDTFGLPGVLPYLTNAQVSYNSLIHLDREDLREAIPPLGLRTEFRIKLFQWRKDKFGIEDSTATVTAKERDESCLEKIDECTTPSTTKAISDVLGKNIRDLLKESWKGLSLLEAAKKNEHLSCDQRNVLIDIILEDVQLQKKKLRPIDFDLLFEQICLVFPKEIGIKDYYYIPRKGKNNAGGRLFNKYKNYTCKKRKLTIRSDGENKNSIDCDNHKPLHEIDIEIATAIKAALNRESSSWSDVCESWGKTFNLRRNDLKELESCEFLKGWSKLTDARAPDLINIDFDFMYPDKGHLLFSKWEAFKANMNIIYERSIGNDFCKQLYAKFKLSKNIDEQDYLCTILLNAIMLPTARLKDKDGKLTKVTIIDAQKSLVTRLETINDYENQMDDVVKQYYSFNLTIQPFIVVHGSAEVEIAGFYVYFDKNLYKMNSFIAALDLCFKIFQVLSLKYTDACSNVWLFIQKYFYNIETEFDFKSATVTSLLNTLQKN